MPLYIRDDTVDVLAEQVKQATGAQSKTEAVRKALLAQLQAAMQKRPLLERIRDIQDMADEIGPVDPDFDMKKFTDDLWGDR